MAHSAPIDKLFVEIGLDPKKFTDGQKAVLSSFKKTAEEARGRAKEIEESGRRSTIFFSQLRTQAIATFAAFAGARGITDFVINTVTADAATGRLSRNLGVSVKTLSAWQNLAVLTGDSAENMAQSFTRLSDTLAGWKIGIIDPLVAEFRALGAAGGTVIDINKGVDQTILDIAANLKAINALDPARAGLLGRRAGISPGLFDLMIHGGRAELQAQLDYVAKLNAATNETAASAANLAKKFHELELLTKDTGRVITPRLSTLADRLKEFVINVNGIIEGLSPEEVKARREGAGLFDLPIKSGAFSGNESLGVIALAASIKSFVPGLKQITAGNDAYHAGTGSAHAKGLALDFTITDPSQSGTVSSQVRAKLAAMGIDAKVIDEYTNPSARSTGSHIHVAFADALAAQRYSDLVSGAAASNVDNRRSSSSTSETTINIGAITTQATNGADLAKDFTAAMRVRQGFSSLANDGQQ